MPYTFKGKWLISWTLHICLTMYFFIIHFSVLYGLVYSVPNLN